ncbi:DUF305 domain-containing protein [Nodosilinea sp. LEGE 07298]|uniref:DUF305 domain-containing protein n=1 Tax=Nodosilinea sp. LEGE 07298 TaxID=2777970 RepID=UPI0018813FB1|nr:DUF305 domain-containing protein [Nodosilinea sp. LEGE 07298]MBE9113649.1 DUF305 domain-containing protein [Nodosilinea sp. LEGE 07298]
MRLTTQSIAAIAGLSLATAGVVAVPYLASSASLQQPGWGPMHQGQMHRGRMMHHMQATNEFEFLSLMIPHHQEAIATAERVLEYSDRPEMLEFAQNIITVQSAEIEQMEAWLGEWYAGQETDLIYAPMMRDLNQLEGDALDQAFLKDMVMHHMGAVMMSQQLLNHGLVEHQPVQPFAQTIANTQRQEIGQMQAWLQDWYGVSGMPDRMHRGQ